MERIIFQNQIKFKKIEKDTSKSGWVQKLQKRWDVSASQVFVILLVFACTGFSVMFLKRPIVALFTDGGEKSLLFSIIYYILILPVYNILLLVYGYIFGQFAFFWQFEKKMLNRILGKSKKEKA